MNGSATNKHIRCTLSYAAIKGMCVSARVCVRCVLYPTVVLGKHGTVCPAAPPPASRASWREAAREGTELFVVTRQLVAG
jgi:hypothetical protein